MSNSKVSLFFEPFYVLPSSVHIIKCFFVVGEAKFEFSLVGFLRKENIKEDMFSTRYVTLNAQEPPRRKCYKMTN